MAAFILIQPNDPLDGPEAAGIRGDNIECIGMGAFRPSAPHANTFPAHATNRRIELGITPRRLTAR
ncbi:MAG: hypothetical protein NTV86_18315 [Planctomycetota bacterium]|nr:hypothetical protein [Planctomycetota bacterium]